MKKRLLFALIVVLCACTLVFFYTDTISTAISHRITYDNEPKTILYWNTFFGAKNFNLGEGFVARHCPRFNNCLATHNRSLQSLDSFDAILFHGISEELDYDLPLLRRPEQKYVFMALESPVNRHIDSEFDGFFNTTMSYHLDSDVVWTYADVIDLDNDRLMTVPSRSNFRWDRMNNNSYDTVDEEQLIGRKTKLMVWYRSNCYVYSGRESYVAELQKHAQVDKYGHCSKNPGCPKDLDCFKSIVEPDYFFYLAFENTLCDEYVTEKLYNALNHYVVPVVYGGADSSRFAPPNSYINALDFYTPKDLANYLTYLSRNLTDYKRYFDWKKHYRVIDSRQRVICDLCEILHRTDNTRRTYEISKWYAADRCFLQHQLYRQASFGGHDYATKKTFYVKKRLTNRNIS